MKVWPQQTLEKNRLSGSNGEQSAGPLYQPKKNSAEAKLGQGKLKNNITGRKFSFLLPFLSGRWYKSGIRIYHFCHMLFSWINYESSKLKLVIHFIHWCNVGSLDINNSNVVNNTYYLLKPVRPHLVHCKCLPAKIRSESRNSPVTLETAFFTTAIFCLDTFTIWNIYFSVLLKV